MKLKIVNQSLILLLSLTLMQCDKHKQHTLTMNSAISAFGHNVLEKGHIVSNPFIQPEPVDQMRRHQSKLNNNNRNKPKYIVSGDIIFPSEEVQISYTKRSKRKIIAEKNLYGLSNRWPHGIIPYEFIPSIDYRVQHNVWNAIEHWHQRTCIRFELYNSSRHWNIGAKIIIEDTGSGCGTFVGYRPSSKGHLSSYSLYLPFECILGSAIHELGHVVGFYHEMARTDRDREINIHFNLMPEHEVSQYNIMPAPMYGFYGQPYDLSSIMHYRQTDFMKARDDRRAFLMGQRETLSYLDTKLANLAYRCGDNCNPKPVCENEGYVNQYCQCTCPDGFHGDRCNLLQGYSKTTLNLHSQDIDKLIKIQTSSSKQSINKILLNADNRWFEWSEWSNCSESCITGFRVRTRLCINETGDGNTNAYSILKENSFEIESCRNPQCKQVNIIMSCTFDLTDELCSMVISGNWTIQEGTQTDRILPIVDHTRGDGKYLVIIGNKNRLDNALNVQLGPFTSSKSLSNDKKHCLQFWYYMYGEGTGKLAIIYNKTHNNQNNYSFTFNWKDQDRNWRLIERTILNADDYKITFAYEPITTQYNYIALDDVSISNGACIPKKISSQGRKKRQPVTSGCSRVIDLSTKNTVVSFTSLNYPNSYSMNALCYYYIRAPQSYRIILQFTDFNIPSNSRNSCDDSVEIRYYHLGQSGPAYCGTGKNSNNLEFISSKNYIMIVFRSDHNIAGRGFRAQAVLVQ